MKKLKVTIIDAKTLRLEEKGDVGDIIDLQEVQSVDTTSLIEAIKAKREATYEAMLASALKSKAFEQEVAISKVEKEIKEKYEAIIKEKDRLALEVSSFDRRLADERHNTTVKINAEYDVKMNKITQEKQALEKSLEEQKRIAVLETEKRLTVDIQKQKDANEREIRERQKRIDDLGNELKSLKEKEALALQSKETAMRLEQERIVHALEANIATLQAELDKANYTKSSTQIKVLGEELEKWCHNEYLSYALAGFENCSWRKDNVAVKEPGDESGSKGDYIFEVFATSEKSPSDRLLGVCLEMKNEAPNTKTKTKNADHYSKLDKDRRLKNCEYALLVSELEWDVLNDAPIRKVNEYPSMYVVRPPYFMSFLAMLKSLSEKYKELLLARAKEDLSFKESQEILLEFESFKNTYLDKPLERLEKDVTEIRKQAINAHDAANKIISLTDSIISTQLNEMHQKIDRFDIRKIAKKIDKLPS